MAKSYLSGGKYTLNARGGEHPASLKGRNLTDNGKICTKCKEEKPLDGFRSEKTSHCNKCLNEYNRNREKRRRKKLW